MRFMVIMKSDQDTEAGILPPDDVIAAMTKYNEELAKSGVLLAAEGLHPSTKGARVRFHDGDQRTVIDGPFAEAKELIAGFWLIQAASMDEAVEWVKRVPATGVVKAFEMEIRQVFELDDFGPSMAPELREAEQRIRTQTGL